MRAGRILGVLALGVLCLYTTAVVALDLPSLSDAVRDGSAVSWWLGGLFYLLLLVRMVLGVIAGRSQARAVLLTGLTLWIAGTTVWLWDLGASQTMDSAGAVLFTLAYTLLVVFVLTDVPRTGRAGSVVWVEAVIVAGGTACLAGTIVLLSSGSGWASDASLMYMLYPILDVGLAAMVLCQGAARMRPRGASTACLAAAFGLMAVSDALIARGGTGPAVDLTCALGIGLLVWTGCNTRVADPREVRPWSLDRMPIFVSLGLSFAGLTVAVVAPRGARVDDVIVPALLTLLAGQVRMGMALREARAAGTEISRSLTDDLTGLPNRRAIANHLDEAIRSGRGLALIILDLDGFKEINDGLGHAAGDLLLRMVGDRVRESLPDGVVFGRLGGDEFAMSLESPQGEELFALARSVLHALSAPFVVDGVQVAVDASLGVAVHEAGDPAGAADDATTMLRRADVAMYQAKSAREGVVLYVPENDEFSRERLELIDALRQAIPAGQIEMWYQPQVDALSGEACGLEALVRWRHPTEGLIPPGVFLPAARRAGLMLRLSEEIVRQVVADLQHWLAEWPVPRVSINVAPPELLGKTLVPFLHKQLLEAGLPADAVRLEVTEDSFVSDPGRARVVLEQLAKTGIGVSIDDYGTGFSSLAYLRDLPVEELKIDRSFIKAIEVDERSRMIVASTATMAHALGMRVVAEGVEDEPTAALLRALDVDVLQGFHYSPPLPFDRVRPWVAERVGAAADQPQVRKF